MAEIPFTAAATLGVVSGMQSMMAPAVISWAANKSGLDLESTPFSAFKGPGIGRTAAALVLGELVANRPAFVPQRSDGTALLTRAVSGGAAGAAVFKSRKQSILLGAAVGAVAAVGAAYASYYIRKRAARYFGISDRAVAFVEDGIAIGAGLFAIAIARPGKEEAIG